MGTDMGSTSGNLKPHYLTGGGLRIIIAAHPKFQIPNSQTSQVSINFQACKAYILQHYQCLILLWTEVGTVCNKSLARVELSHQLPSTIGQTR